MPESNDMMPTSAHARPAGLNLDIQNVSCRPHGSILDASRKYSLTFCANEPALCSGMQKEKSDYVGLNKSEILWERPFGASFTLFCPTSDPNVTITLRQRRRLHPSQNIGTCIVGCSMHPGTQSIQSPVTSNEGVQLAVLTLTARMTAADAGAAVQEASSANSEMGSTPNDPIDQHQPALAIGAAATSQTGLHDVLERLHGFMRLTGLAAEIHPWVKLAWGVVSVAYKVYEAQVRRDDSIQRLVEEMDESCKAAKEATPLGDWSEHSNEIVVKILQQVIQCTYFVKEYCSKRSFGGRLVKNIMSLVDEQAQGYIDNLRDLRRSLCGQASTVAAVMVYCVFDELEKIGKSMEDVEALELFKEMEFASQAFGNAGEEARCLDGTRTEIIDTIVRWALHADCSGGEDQIDEVPKLSARVLWLCGVAGSGKSRISRSIADRLQKLKRLGSLYCCDYRNRATLNPGSLFSTIAQHLAGHDPLRKRRLVDAIKDDKAIRTARICGQQYQNFIVTPSTDLPIVGDTIIVIDAFDEIGSVEDRMVALDILSRRAHELPPGLRIVVTSRFEDDIQEALQSPKAVGVDYILMEHIPAPLTKRDITRYVHHVLGDTRGLGAADFDKLAMAAGESFQWASTACRYIRNNRNGRGTQRPRDRLPLVLASNQDLDKLYMQILDEHFGEEPAEGLEKLRLVLGLILRAEEPISIRTISELVPRDFSDPHTSTKLDDLQCIVRHLASLLVNTHDVDQSISPLHTSFADFLQDVKRCHKYLINIEETNKILVLGCLKIMEHELRFNICRISTSYLANKDVENLSTLVKEYISPHLLYASRFWAQHLSYLTDVDDVICSMLWGLLSNHFLEWLEVMSVTDASFQVPLATISSSEITRVRSDIGSVIRDLTQFTSVFAAPIHQSAPHIYLSALAFAPTSSVLHGLCQRFPQSVILRHGRTAGWPRLVHVFTGHSRAVNAVAISPDGSLVVSASCDITIRFWSTATGGAVGEPLEGHSDWVNSVAFSPDGRCVASGSNDGTIRLWSVKTFATIGEPLKGHDNYVISVAFSPDGTRVASSSQDKTIRLWEVATGSPIVTLVGHEGAITSITFSPHDDFLISISHDKTTRVWDATTGAAIGEPLHTDGVNCVAFSRDGTKFASASYDKTIQLWDPQTFVAIGEPLQGHSDITCLAFSPDGTQIASGSWGETIQLWDASTGAAMGEPLRGHTDVVTSLAFLPDGSQLVSSSSDKTVRQWNMVTDVAFGESSQHTEAITCVAISGDGKYVASCSSDQTVRVWDTTIGVAVGRPFRGHREAVVSVAFSPDDAIIASGSHDTTIRLWQATTGELIKELTGHDEAVTSLVFTPDGTRVVSGSRDCTIQRWNVATGEPAGEPLRGHNRAIRSVTASPNGTLIASASEDWTVRVWDLNAGTLIGKPLEGHDGGVNSVVFSPDDTKIASGSDDTTIRLWGVKTQAMIGKPLKGHSSLVTSVVFSHDGAFIVSGSWGKTVQVWNVETGTEVSQPLRRHTHPIASVASSPDGVHVVSGSIDKSVRLWNIADILAKGAINRNDLAKPAAVIRKPSTYAISCEIATQYPPHLFPLPTFKMQDGWILGPNDELLLWVPPANQSGLLGPFSRSRIMGDCTELDFSSFKCGAEWMQCREPIETK